MTSQPNTYDLIVAGAGCAGLSFLWHLVQSPYRDRRVLLVDRSFTPPESKEWCFWGDDALPFRELARTSWPRMRVAFPGLEVVRPLRGMAYHCVMGEDYHAAVMERLRRHPNVEYLEAGIEAIRDEPEGAAVVAGGQTFRAPYVFQNCFLSEADRARPVHYPVRQHFGGWEIEAPSAPFDPDTVTLMDFDTPQRGATVFFYVLPFTARRALVECTVFSTTPWPRAAYDDAIAAYLARHEIGPFEVVRHEYGCVPMEERRLSQRWGAHVFNLGTVGGMTKPTTGYTFQRIHRQTQHLVKTLTTHGRPHPVDFTHPRFRFYDLLLLYLLARTPEHGRPIFRRLFEHNPFERVLTFIDEQSHLGQDLLIFSRLPWAPFLRAIPPNLPLLPATLFARV